NDGTLDFTAPLGTARWTKIETEITAPRAYRGITFHITKSGTGTAVLAQLRVQASMGCTGAPLALHDLPLGDAGGETSECAAGLQCAGKPDGGGYGLCSECSTGMCLGGVPCAARSFFMALQCGPGQHLGAAGAPCLAGADCASGTCDGARPVPLSPGDG